MSQNEGIHLSQELLRRLRTAASESGRTPEEVVNAALDMLLQNRPTLPTNGHIRPYEAFERAGAIGCISGPGDLSTNPKYFEGFGRD